MRGFVLIVALLLDPAAVLLLLAAMHRGAMRSELTIKSKKLTSRRAAKLI
jgi:hypothetical protein